MKKQLYLGLLIALAVLLGACADVNGENGHTTLPTSDTPSTQATTEAVTTEDEPETTVPTHSALYLPQYSAQQMTEYFEEIVLQMEYTDGTGDAALVQKWNTPICYNIFGDPTEKDLSVLNDLFDQINEIEGFPGISAAPEGEIGNLIISFLNEFDFNVSFSEMLNGEDAYGAAQFWYNTDTNEIYDARIGYRTDIDQTTRVSILLEEIVNVLGTSDTVLREDSIVYQYSNDNYALSDVDWVILKLLYNPAIRSGMNADDCRTIIQELYY